MKTILTLFMISFGLNCAGQTYSQSDFSLYQVPKAYSKEWYRLANSSVKSFTVSVVGGELQITEYKSSSGKEYPITGGKLLVLDIGELGGGLYYKPDDTSKKVFFVNGQAKEVNNRLEEYNKLLRVKPDSLIKGECLKIGGGNTQMLVRYKNGWLVTQTMFPKSNNGWLSQLTMQNDSFYFSKIVDLGSAPTALAIAGDKIFVASYNGFYCILDGKKEAVLDNLSWQGLYPNSIAIIDERNIYVGVFAGYAHIDLVARNITFYKYRK